MHVLITTDRFTGADTSRRVSEALAAGWLRGAPHDTVELCPLSDGGPGWASLLAQVSGWPQPDPDGVLVMGETAYLDTAVALCSDPQGGSGAVAAQLLRAVASGASRIVVGLGSPADLPALPDAGAGMLAALGTTVDDEDARGLGEVLASLRGVDLVAAVATDIPLLGLHGASAGAADAGWASREAAQLREREIGQRADVLWRARQQASTDAAASGAAGPSRSLLAGGGPGGAGGAGTGAGGASGARTARGRSRDLTGLPGAGAGGGLGFAFALLGARLLPGASVFAQVAGLTARALAADLVVTAREDLDGASFHGSGVEQAAAAASSYGVACVALYERSMMNRRELAAVGLSASYSLAAGPAESGTTTVVDRAGTVAQRVARSWSPAWSGGHSRDRDGSGGSRA
ncbi:glycerate kinase [Sanguibacter suarezii]|uniref:glycerate kinase n=1 Tax=Sanguibacter suarezii TaxID=60921 RepID=UPI000830F18D|nr:glycerate kinase [Sanguibacter suarezii]